MNKLKIDAIKALPSITDDEYAKIITTGFKTGSSVYGGFDIPTSDIDYIVKPDFNINEFDGKFIRLPQQYVESNNDVYYVHYESKIINILLMHTDKEYKKWRETTTLMYELNLNDKFKKYTEEKRSRVAMFKFFREKIVCQDEFLPVLPKAHTIN